MALRPRDLNRETFGEGASAPGSQFVDTPQGPEFVVKMAIHVPLRSMLKKLSAPQISKVIRECERELGERDE